MPVAMQPITLEAEYSQLAARANALNAFGAQLPNKVFPPTYNLVGFVDTWGLRQIPLGELLICGDELTSLPTLIVMGMGGGDYKRSKGVFPCFQSISIHDTPSGLLSEVLIDFPRKRKFPARSETQENLLDEMRCFGSWMMFSMDEKWIIWGDCEFGVAIFGIRRGEPVETFKAAKRFSLCSSAFESIALTNFPKGFEEEYDTFMQTMKENYPLIAEN